MQQIAGFEVRLSAKVSASSVSFGDQCCPCADGQNIQKEIRVVLSDSISTAIWMEGP
jgi:hypothetical protein